MDTNLKVLLVALVFFFLVGMAIFLVWKLFEPNREGEKRSLVDFVIKPAAVMAIGVACLGIFIIFPWALQWIIGVLVIIAVVAFLRMSASQKVAMAKAIEKPDPTSRWPGTRLVLATILVFAAIAGLFAIFVP